MRRLSPSIPFVAVLGLAITLPVLVPAPCFGFHWQHGTAVVTTYPVAPVYPVALAAPVYMMSTPMLVPATTAVTSAAPSYVAPMVAPYSVPVYHYTSAPVAPMYYQPAAVSTTQSAPQAASLPVAPFAFLSSFNPDAPLMPGVAGYEPAMPQAKGSRILQGLRSAIVGNKGMLFGPLLQLAVNLFGQEFGFTPNAQDASILSGLVSKVLGEVLGVSPSTATPNTTPTPPPTPAPTPNPSAGGGQAAPTQGAQTLVITITLPADSRISVQQGGQQPGPQSWQPAGQPAGSPGTNPMGTSGGPGKP